MNSKQKIALGIAGAGVVLNVVDAITAQGDPAKGVVYGDGGWLAPINDKSPVQVGLLLIAAGVLGFAYLKWGRK